MSAMPSFWLVFPDKAETPQTIHSYLSEYAYHLPALRDPEHTLVKLSPGADHA